MRKAKILSFFIFFLLFGCNDMNLNPLTSDSSETWYSDEDEIEQALNKLYDLSYWENFYINGGDTWYEPYPFSWSDDWQTRIDISAIAGGTLNGETGIIKTIWERCYECIAAANIIINSVDNAKDNVSEEQLNEYIADAKFIRAVQYSELIFYFGDIPFYTKYINIEEAFSLPRTEKSTVLQSIYEDFDFAATYLPESYSDNELQHATKGAALAMKARIALYMEDWEVASKAANECINLGVYELYPDFGEYFREKNAIETVFAIPRSVELGIYMGRLGHYQTRNSGGGYSTVQPTWDLLCSYLCTDGLPIDESPLYNPHNPFENRDPRCTSTIVEFGTYWLGVMYQPHPDTLSVWDLNLDAYRANNDSRGVNQYASYNGLAWRKWIGDENGKWYQNNQGDFDNVIIRYADVLLIYAEAKIESGNVDQSVLDAINKVRARAYGVDYEDGSLYPAVTETSLAELRKTIRFERRMEFALEGALRYKDIIRWKLAEKVLNNDNYGMLDPDELREKIISKGLWFFPEVPEIDDNGVPDFTSMYNKGLIKLLADRQFDASKNYLWPIPTSEILINENLTQNVGY